MGDAGMIAETALWDMILAAERRMGPRMAKLWETLRVSPRLWREPRYRDQAGGFWVVGVIGTTAIWYDDIEEGFTQSPFEEFGVIGRYSSGDRDLEGVLQQVANRLGFELT